MKVSIGSDKSGFVYKTSLCNSLKKKGFDVADVGTFSNTICDYPDYAEQVSNLVASGNCEFGILICGSGEGMAIAANKVKGIRCGIGYNDEVSVLLREHNDANVISFGAKFMSFEDVERRTFLFLNAKFVGEHHIKRIELIKKMEE